MPQVVNNDRKAQYEFYKILAPKLKGVAVRYLKDNREVDDVIQDTFMSIFTNISDFKGNSRIDTWAIRILINNILQKINRNQKHEYSDIENEVVRNNGDFADTDGNLLHAELIQLINCLPSNKKIIFNLYVIEGYSHKEISEMLNITEGVSKTQLFRAKEMLVSLHNKMNNVRTDT